jgi:ribonuclease-3
MKTDAVEHRRAESPETLRDLGERIGYAFSDPRLLEEALTHASYANESGAGYYNERLEYLGDAVLELCVSEFLFVSRPEYDEGELTKARARVVCASSLASWAGHIGLSDLLLLSRGLETQGGRVNLSILADAMEAVLGAVFLDGGYEAAFGVVRGLVETTRPLEVGHIEPNKDSKTRLQEALQATGEHPPTYRLTGRSGPDHALVFEVEAVLSDGRVLAVGQGSSIKSAEFAAAESALNRLRDQNRTTGE